MAADPYAYTYWAPPPPPADAKKEKKPKAITTPQFYENEADLPEPPPGLSWKMYKPVPPPGALLNETVGVPAFNSTKVVDYLRNASANKVKAYSDDEIARFVFFRDQTAKVDTATLQDIDKATLANVRDRSPTLWVHALTAWVVSAATLALLAKFSREAVSLRLRYLSTAPKGAETHSVLVTDVPGVAGGTVMHKVDSTVFKALPASQRAKVKGLVSRASELAASRFDKAASAVGVDTRGSSLPSSLEVDPWGKAAAFLKEGGTPEALVEKEFGELFPQEVAHVQVRREKEGR